MNGPGVPNRRYLAVLLGGTLAIAAPTALALAVDKPRTSDKSQSSPTAGNCLGTGVSCGPVAKGSPSRDAAARGVGERTELRPDERTVAQDRLPEVRSIIHQGQCNPACTGPDAVGAPDDPPTAAQLDRITAALTSAGYTDVAARQARGDDPAPPGATIYSAAVGPACILVYQLGRTGRGGENVVGKRPDGHCLAP
jgi:hypothetical protein